MLGTAGADDTMQRILSGDLNTDQMAALKSLITNPDKTLGMCSTSQSPSYIYHVRGLDILI
jgi:CobQ-like glutamine amidotransferase family enzyme